MKPKKKIAILVAGMHRSGTSALAGALNLFGVSLGGRLLEPGQDNPKGYWEHQDAVAIHEQLLEALGRRWDDVRPLPGGWTQSEAAQIARSQIAELVQQDFNDSEIWAVKDPRICRFLALWLEVLKESETRVIVLFAARAPSEVAASIKARNHWALPIGELLWLRHVIEAESASRQVERTVLLYEDLVANPAAAISGALARVGVHTSNSNLVVDQNALARFVDSADRHHVHPSLSRRNSPLSPIAENAYDVLKGIAHEDQGEGWNSLAECASALDAEWSKYGAIVSAVADMAYMFSASATSKQAEIFDLTSKLNAQISWSEGAILNIQNLHEEVSVLSKDRDKIRDERDYAVGELSKAQDEQGRLHSYLEEISSERDQTIKDLNVSMERCTNLELASNQLRNELDAIRNELSAIRGHWSWKIMGPIRAATRLIKMAWH